jgi:hypothetical protein
VSICLTCGHYSHPDGEMERVQRSGSCACRCHPWNHPPDPEPRVCRDCGRTIDTGSQDDCCCVDEDEE